MISDCIEYRDYPIFYINLISNYLHPNDELDIIMAEIGINRIKWEGTI